MVLNSPSAASDEGELITTNEALIGCACSSVDASIAESDLEAIRLSIYVLCCETLESNVDKIR